MVRIIIPVLRIGKMVNVLVFEALPSRPDAPKKSHSRGRTIT
jgi:hypothetical protein